MLYQKTFVMVKKYSTFWHYFLDDTIGEEFPADKSWITESVLTLNDLWNVVFFACISMLWSYIEFARRSSYRCYRILSRWFSSKAHARPWRGPIGGKRKSCIHFRWFMNATDTRKEEFIFMFCHETHLLKRLLFSHIFVNYVSIVSKVIKLSMWRICGLCIRASVNLMHSNTHAFRKNQNIKEHNSTPQK